MKKRLLYTSLIILAFSVAALWLLPLGLGYLIQYRYNHMLKALSQSTHTEIKMVDYKRHWFDSEVTLEVDLSHAMNFWHLPPYDKIIHPNAKSNHYVIAQKITHGPILRVRSADKKIRWLPGIALIETKPLIPFESQEQHTRQNLKGKGHHSSSNPQIEAIHSLTLIRLTGSLLSGVTISKLEYKNPQADVSFQLQGLTATLDLSSNLKRIVFQVNIPRINFQNAEVKQQLIGFTANYRLNRSHSGLFLGTTHNTIKQMSWYSKNPQTQQIQIKEIDVTTESEEKKQRLDYRLKAKIQKILVNNATFGEQELDVSMSGMDIPSLLALAAELKEASHETQPLSLPVQRYQQQLDRLIKSGMEIHLNKLALSTAWGQPQMNGKIGWTKALTDQPLKQTLYADLEFYLPVAFLNRALTVFYQRFSTHVLLGSLLLGNATISPAQTKEITQWVQHTTQLWRDRQWLIPKGQDHYQIHLQYQSGQLKINDQRVNVL